ncbi:MAG: hypothetical protein HRU12_09630 [Phaeodactylibacter sp.]|nr:hypothetical protein [Phaeodactylibacter sp.]
MPQSKTANKAQETVENWLFDNLHLRSHNIDTLNGLRHLLTDLQTAFCYWDEEYKTKYGYKGAHVEYDTKYFEALTNGRIADQQAELEAAAA